jgi:excisionase family DNA binding protein
MADQPLLLATRAALRPAEAAAALGVSIRKLREFLPGIPHIRDGNTVLIPVASLNKWLEERAAAQDIQVEQAVDEILGSIE